MSFTKAEKEDYKSKSSQIHGQTKLKNHQMNPELTRSARYRHNPLVESDSSKDTGKTLSSCGSNTNIEFLNKYSR